MHGVRETEQRNREKNNTTERKKQLKKKKNRRVSNFTPLTEKEEKSLQSKKLNYCDGVCVTSNSYTTTRERER